MTPPALDHVVKKCLAKDPDERWQSARDLASELKWIAESGGHTAGLVPSHSAGKNQRNASLAPRGALAVALIVTAIWWRNSKPPEQTMYFSAPMPFPARDLAFSPNGHTLAVVAYWESARKNGSGFTSWDRQAQEASTIPRAPAIHSGRQTGAPSRSLPTEN